MLMDINLEFSASQAVTATATSTNAYDLEVGLAITTTFTKVPPAVIGNATFFGMDLGMGKGQGTPYVVCKNVNANNAATATSLTVAFQGAPMNNTALSSGNRSDLAFVTYIQTGTLGVALLTAGSEFASFAWPQRQLAAALPRFVQLNYTVAGSNFTNLTVTADVSLGDDSAQNTLGQYPSNY